MKDEIVLDFRTICSNCWKQKKVDENFYTFVAEDDLGEIIKITGHKNCMNEIKGKLEAIVNGSLQS